MSFFNDTICQLCERFITKEDWFSYFYSSRHLHREVFGYWPTYFAQRNLVRDESNKPQKAFRKMFFALRDNKEVEEFQLTYFLMTKNLKDYILEDNEEIRKLFRDTMEGQFEHHLFNKSSSKQLESDETDTLQQRIKWWLVVVDRGAPIANNVYDYSLGELFAICCEAIDPEIQELSELLRGRQIIP